MAALAFSATSFHDQKDLRSAAKPFKRDRDITSKWAFGTRGIGHNLDHKFDPIYSTRDMEERAGLPANYREKPKKRIQRSPNKSHANARTGNVFDSGKASNRLSRKADISHDSHTSTNLSHSLLDLLPGMNGNTRAASTKDDNTILYSFDAVSSPFSRKAVGLDALVDKAEKEWVGKETEKIVRREWEMLDAEGERVAGGKGKGRKVSKAGSEKNVVGVEEDDWECL